MNIGNAADKLFCQEGWHRPALSLFCQSFHCLFLHTAENDVFSKVRVCAAQRSNESPSGAFKRQNGLAQQDGGASPRQVHVDTARFLW